MGDKSDRLDGMIFVPLSAKISNRFCLFLFLRISQLTRAIGLDSVQNVSIESLLSGSKETVRT